MSYIDYARISWAQFNLKCEGWSRKQMESWRQTRAIAWHIYATAPKKEGHETLDMVEYMPFRGDPKKRKISSDSEMNRILSIYKKAGLFKDGKIIHN